MRNPILSLCFLLFATLTSTAVYAQNAQISGIIKDQTGAILPGVTVTARNVETGLSRSAVSQTAGEFRIPALPPGTYTVITELSGFAVETRPDIVLIIDQDAVINFTLKPARVAEAITVVGESPIVDTTAGR